MIAIRVIRVSGNRELLCPKPSLSMGICGVRVSQRLSPSLAAAFGGRLSSLAVGISASLIAERVNERLLHARRGCDISAPSVSRADGDLTLPGICVSTEDQTVWLSR